MCENVDVELPWPSQKTVQLYSARWMMYCKLYLLLALKANVARPLHEAGEVHLRLLRRGFRCSTGNGSSDRSTNAPKVKQQLGIMLHGRDGRAANNYAAFSRLVEDVGEY